MQENQDQSKTQKQRDIYLQPLNKYHIHTKKLRSPHMLNKMKQISYVSNSFNKMKLKPLKQNKQEFTKSFQKQHEVSQEKVNFKEYQFDPLITLNLLQTLKNKHRNNLERIPEKRIFPEKIAYLSKTGQNNNGNPKTNQDRYLFEQLNPNQKLIAVLDGHGQNGHHVSQYLKENFPRIFTSFQWNNDEDLVYEQLQLVFQKIKSYLLLQRIDSHFSGSTVALSLIVNDVLYCANLGDSRVILASETENNKYTVKQLTQDHNPDLPQEKARIESMGGFVYQFRNQLGQSLGPQRVWNDQGFPGLAMARSMGDFQFHSIGISNTPEITKYQIQSQDRFIIWGSDGIYQYLSNKQVMDIVRPYYDTNDAKGASQKLVALARESWAKLDNYIDDITAVVLFLPSTLYVKK